ncbi:MAG TPA: hypothetical protein VNS79_02600 [Sphingobium sp.]|nr:hypothetical protein [Sphingobium sp.]
MSIESRRREFHSHVWNHSVDPFQLQFDDRRPLNEREIDGLEKIAKAALLETDATKACATIQRELKLHAELFAATLQVVGLTRNKILQDLKAAARSAPVVQTIPTNYARLPFTAAWTAAGPYLLRRLQQVFRPLVAEFDDEAFGRSVEALNQATWPGYIRQERAKRSGHEAEGRMAQLLLATKFPFEPEEKADNPLCRDAQIGGISFDLVVPSVKAPALVFKATVHTSNIGQYGESKDHLEVDEAKRWLDGAYSQKSRPKLVALIDGVGFESNRAGLDGVLEKADEFCQFRTIWKIVAMASTALERPVKIFLPQAELDYFADFIKEHSKSAEYEVYDPAVLTRYPPEDIVVAGDATIVAS